MDDTLESLRLTLPYRSLSIVGGPHKYFKAPPVSNNPIIWSTGGLGDCLLSMNLAEAIQQYTGQEVIFYTRYPEVVRLFSDLDARDEKQFIPVGADYWITLNTLVLFNFQKNFRGFKNPKMQELFMNYRSFLSRGDWKFIVNRQPFMENITGIEAVKLGLNRQTLIFKILGLPFTELKKQPKQSAAVLRDPFITIHDGYDNANENIKDRSMKNWTIEHWEQVTELLKYRGKLKVLQLGGPTSRKIPGVNYDLVGKLTLNESMQVLAKSLLHLDSESGLVHAAHMMGVKSLVLFGPTNLKFFGYEDNINIAPNFCGDCWWLKQNWMAKCPLGYVAPLCMDSIDPLKVANKAMEFLNGRV